MKLGKYFFEFLSVFIAVIAAFALNNWSEYRRNTLAEEKILIEIRNGLKSDLEELKINKEGHEAGLSAYYFFKDVLKGKNIAKDSTDTHYFNLTNSATLNINKSGYQSLKSRGLEIVRNDSLRAKIIELYEFDYVSLKKFEENSSVTQFFGNYFIPINDILSPFLLYDDLGDIKSLEFPLELTVKQKKLLESYLWQISLGRYSLLAFYDEAEIKLIDLLKGIDDELEKRR